MSTFGERIIEVRKLRGLTQKDLGDSIGVDKRVISKYENNQTIPSVIVANSIAKVLEISLDYLMGNDDILTLDKQTIKRIEEIDKLDKEKKNTLLDLIDTYIRDSKTRKNQS